MSEPEWIIKFEQRNGQKCVQVNGRLYYSNGAWRDTGIWAPWGDAPEDELKRWRNQIVYWRVRVEHTRDEFNFQKQGIASRIKDCGSSLNGSIEKLESLQKKAQKAQKMYSRFKKKIDEHPVNASRRKTKAENEASKARELERLSKIRI